MFIIARTFNQVSQRVMEKTRKKWVVVIWVAGAALVTVGALGVVILLQRREISSSWYGKGRSMVKS